MLDLYLADIVDILRPIIMAIKVDVVCALIAPPVARVMGRPAKKILWIEVETIGQDRVMQKPVVSFNIIGTLFFMTALQRSSNLHLNVRSPTKIRSPTESDTSYTVWIYMPTVFNNISRPSRRDLFGAFTIFQ